MTIDTVTTTDSPAPGDKLRRMAEVYRETVIDLKEQADLIDQAALLMADEPLSLPS